MPLQINTTGMNQLITRHKRERAILKGYYQNQVDWGEMEQLQMEVNLAENTAILKILEAVKAKKTTRIKVEQIKLF